MLTISQLRSTFLDYFVEKGHTLVESAPLLTQNDPSLLFVNSGMVPFKECFRGLETRPYVRATSCQKSVRVSGKHNDYEQIGQTPRHHTFFEMLGNFSLGDYFKKEAIAFAWELLTERLKISKDFLWVTVHHSDDEAVQLWQDVTGISADRIIRLGDDSNLWIMGDFGPRGYSSEIFYYMGNNPAQQSREEFLKDDGTYLEIWNLVFMQFNRNLDGTVVPLPKPCIDTGSGLERLASVLQGVKSNFDTNEVRDLIAQVEAISGVKYDGTTYEKTAVSPRQWEVDVAMRVIADHARSIAFLIADGVAPSNEKEGYVLRRLIRRATLRGEVLGISRPFLTTITDRVVSNMCLTYPELTKQADAIRQSTSREEQQFRKTLRDGLKLLDDAVQDLKAGTILAGETAFKLHDTYGFPLDLTEDILKEKNISVDSARFEVLMNEQRDRSRGPKNVGGQSSVASIKELQVDAPPSIFTGYDSLKAESKVQALIPTSADNNTSYLILDSTPFYAEMGGQIGDKGTIQIDGNIFNVIDTQKTYAGHFVHVVTTNEKVLELLVGKTAWAAVDSTSRCLIAQNHSATHLLGAALRKVLGSHVEQRGSLVTAERFRFDFTHPQPVTGEQLQSVQDLINEIIRENYPVTTSSVNVSEAKKRGAVAVFGEKYGDVVRLVEMGPLSIELCGGTHTSYTGNIGMELIVSEGSVATGIRRIEGLAGSRAVTALASMQQTLKQLAAKTNGTVTDLPARLDALQQQTVELSANLKERDKIIAGLMSEKLFESAQTLNEARYVIAPLKVAMGRDTLMAVAEQTVARLALNSIVILGHKESGNVVVAVSSDRAPSFGAHTFVKQVSQNLGGKGGGKPQLASLVNVPSEKFDEIFTTAKHQLGL